MRATIVYIMLRRFLMRRAYNNRKWGQARKIANEILTIPKERKLARSIIIRSYYNEGEFEMVIKLNSQWDGDFQYLVERIRDPEVRFEANSERIKKIHVIKN